jgi:hypothetical protein
MGTATVERLAKGIFWDSRVGGEPNGLGQLTQEFQINLLRQSINPGNTILASDLNRIGSLINNLNGHYHTYDDAYSLKTFGNTGAGSPLENKNTNSIDSVTDAPVNTQRDETITATIHNGLLDAINNLRSHRHGINDRTAI